MKPLLVAALAAGLAGVSACDRTPSAIPTAPTTAPASTAPVAPTVVDVVVSGKASLSIVGETTQLTATATFSDGSVRGVTGEALWTSSDPSILAVSPAGLVTVVSFGRALVSAMYDAKSAGQMLEAAPEESMAISRINAPWRPPPRTRGSRRACSIETRSTCRPA